MDKANERIDALEVATPSGNHEGWLKRFVNDTELDAFVAVVGAASIAASGMSYTNFVVNESLNDEQKEGLVRQTRTDYVTIEHLDNNILATDYYQNSEQIELIHTEKKEYMRKKDFKLLISIIKTNERILEQQKKLVERYQFLSEEQEKQERLNKITRYLAFSFITTRIIIYCITLFS